MQFETDVTQIIQRIKSAKSIRFKRPQDFAYLPGQWIFLTLDGKGQKTKPLSLSSSPTEDFLEVTKRLTGQEFSNALDALKAGDKALIHGPYGNFTFQGEYDRIGMLSGGIGITPLRSIIRYSTDKGLKTSIVLLYSSHDEDNIAFNDDLNEMQSRNPNLRVINTITGPIKRWKGLTGRIDRQIIENVLPDYVERIFYTSGPKPMVDAMRSLLISMGTPEAQMKQEYFTGYEELL
ncbi:MAG: ferredoxin--NADP reductase [Methanotrichaceae archaeon]